ncbi:hypothetical protein N7475_008685 [Penicillium sp. IBT 31633x]|nr:hypothetical protein N7475_008685 [Penicillium sp. IBT 31633x]
MEKRRRVELSFSEMLTTCQADGQADDEAWRQALIKWHQERGEHSAASNLATAVLSPEIPLADSVLAAMPAASAGIPNTQLAQPAINAAGENHILLTCKPDDPKAQERIKENTKRLVECDIVDKLRSDPVDKPSPKPAEPAEPPSTAEDAPEVDRFARVRAAHMRYWEAMEGVEQMIRDRGSRRSRRPHRAPRRGSTGL